MFGTFEVKREDGNSQTSEQKKENQSDSCSVISDWSQTDDGAMFTSFIAKHSQCWYEIPALDNSLSDGTEVAEYSESDVGPLMRMLFRKQLYTDVRFYPKVGKDSLWAHRTVLAAKCRFFRELLFGAQTKEAEAMVMSVEISNLHFSTFKRIIEYFYTDEIDLEDVYTLLDIFYGAKNFQVKSIIEKCESRINSLELTEDNVCSIFQICNDRNIKCLRNRCISYIEENTENVIRSETFEKCIYNTVYAICNLPTLNLKSEEQLLDAVIHWSHTHPPHIVPHLIKSLIPGIRFLTLKAAELGRIIKKYSDIMTADEALKIMIFVNDSPETRNVKDLPPWCNKSIQKRCLKRDNTESAPKGSDIEAERNGKILISLKPAVEPQEITKQSSVLQIECVKGIHKISGIKFLFQDINLNESILLKVFLRITQRKIILNLHKHFVTKKKEKLFEFFDGIRVFEGQHVDIEITATSSKGFSLYCLDENQDSLQNEYFQCHVCSQPAAAKQFIVSEVQYTSQVNKEDEVLFKKAFIGPRFKNTTIWEQRKKKKREKKKCIGQDVNVTQDSANDRLTSNACESNNNQHMSCLDVENCGTESNAKTANRNETIEKSAEAEVSLKGITQQVMMPSIIEKKYGKKKESKHEADEESSEIPECDRQTVVNNRQNVNQGMLQYSKEEVVGKSSSRGDIETERNEKLKDDKVREVNVENNYIPGKLPSSEKINGNQNSKLQVHGKGKMIEKDKNTIGKSRENGMPTGLLEIAKRKIERQDIDGQELIDKENILERDKQQTTSDKVLSEQTTPSFTSDKQLEKHRSRPLHLNQKISNIESKIEDDEQKETCERNAEIKVDKGNDDHKTTVGPIGIKSTDVGRKWNTDTEMKIKETLDKDNEKLDNEAMYYFPFLLLGILIFVLLKIMLFW